MGLGDLESVILTFGTDNRREGVLVMSRVSERSELETSDSEKLLVLDNDVAKLLTELTRSVIDGTVLSSTCLLSNFLLRHRSEDRALCMTLLIKDSG